MQTAAERIASLRAAMKSAGVQAYIIPSADPHLSEYSPAHWEARKYFSGFTGSAGTLVVTQNKSGLWTDGRYFIQAEQQLKGSGIAGVAVVDDRHALGAHDRRCSGNIEVFRVFPLLERVKLGVQKPFVIRGAELLEPLQRVLVCGAPLVDAIGVFVELGIAGAVCARGVREEVGHIAGDRLDG